MLSSELNIDRRAKILAKTREIIRKTGTPNVSVRELAKSCGVSVPTIYNQFKSKENLIMMAWDVILRDYFEQYEPPLDKPDLDTLVTIMDGTCDCTLQNKTLSRWAITFNPATPSKSSLLMARGLARDCLVSMQKEGHIAKWVPIAFFSDRLYYRMRATGLEWALGHINDGAFKHLRRCEIAICLLGFSSADLTARLRKLLELESAAFIIAQQQN